MSAQNIFVSSRFLTLMHTLQMKDDNKNISMPQKINCTVNLAIKNATIFKEFKESP